MFEKWRVYKSAVYFTKQLWHIKLLKGLLAFDLLLPADVAKKKNKLTSA